MTTANRGRPRLYDRSTELQMLLDAAISVLKRNGFREATLNDILDEAGLATRAFYRHFESKSDLIMAIRQQDAEFAAARIRKRMATTQSPWQAVEVWVDEMLSMVFDARRARRIAMLGAEVRSADVDAHHDYFGSIMSAPLVTAIEQWQVESGVLTNAKADALSIYAVCLDTIRGCRTERFGFTKDEAVAHVLRFCRPAMS
ncbi:TetR/AcrR family transcriptional regulator [Jatrophihabitans sp. DSM 45814]